MKELAIGLPGIGQIQGYPFLKPELSGASLGQLISAFASLAVLIAAVLMFVWFVWAVFEYIIADGDKETLAKARKKMRWTIVGFLLFTVSFAISQWVATLLKPKTIIIPSTISRPGTTVTAPPVTGNGRGADAN